MSHDYDDDGCSNETAWPSGFLKLEEIEGGQLKWLWGERVPVGQVTVLAGEAGSGKSMLAAEIAARVSSSTGEPDGAATKAGTVVVAHSNRHENSVLKRRLIAAGAAPERLVVFNRDAEGYQDKTPDGALLCALEGTLIQIRDASLVVIDHLLGWLGQARPRPEELASLFEKLAEMAARYRVGLVVLWRLEKAGRAAQTRALEALSSAAPVVWLLANDFYDPHARLAVCAQNRLGKQSENLAFRFEADRLLWQMARQWTSAEDVLAWRTADRHERRQAGQWLLDLLSQGPIDAQRLWEEARQCGLAERTIRRAAAELDLHPTKDGKSGVWLWGVRSPGGAMSLPAPEAPAVEAAPNVAALPAVNSVGVGSLADSAVMRVELRPDAAPNVAALPPVGSLADSEVEDQKALVEVIAAASAPVAKTTGGDASGPTASLSARQQRRLRRRERRAIESTLSICRDG